MEATEWKSPNGSHRMKATERKQPDRNLRNGNRGAEAAEWKPRNGNHRMEVTERNLRNGSHEMDATERKQPDTSCQTQATMQRYDTVALWHDGRSYSSRIMIPSIGGTVTLICF